MPNRELLHLSTYLQGGAGRILTDLAVDQKRRGWEVRVVVSRTEYPGYCNYAGHLKALHQAGIPVDRLDSLFKRDASLNKRVVDFLAEKFVQTPPDCIHAHAAIPAALGRQACQVLRCRVPIIQTMQGWGTNKSPGQEAQDVAILNSVDRVVAVSACARAVLIGKGVDPQRITVIPNAVARSHGVLAEPERPWVEAFKGEDFLVACVGSLCTRKNQQALIKAVSLLRREGKCVKLMLIGDEEQPGSHRQMAVDQGIEDAVRIFGQHSEARAFLQFADLMCLPSLSEGLPLSVLECFADRVGVAVSRIPELEELVEDGNTGLLFDPHDSASIADSIRTALYLAPDGRERMLERGYSRYQQEYSLPTLLKRYDQLYEEVIYNVR